MIDSLDQSIYLQKCRSCNSSSLEVHSSRNKFPLYIWPLPFEENTQLVDIHVYVCDDCGYIQLQNMNDEIISSIYRDEAFNIENRNQKLGRLKLMLIENGLKFEKTKVLEIGGGRNTFLGILPNSSEKWVADFSIDEDVQSKVEGAFEGDFVDIEITQKDFDYIFMFHVLEHFNDPGSALKKAKKLLNSYGKIIIELPNFGYESEYLPDYTFFHMHISLFTQTSLVSLMMRHGFSCSNLFKEDEVLLAEFSLGGTALPQNHLEDSLKYLSNVESNISKCHSKLEALLDGLSGGKIAIFGGGGASTLFLYNYPFLIDRVTFALDNHSNKIGRTLCNGKVEIVSPDKIRHLNIRHVIVLDAAHIDYVANDEVNYINIGAIYES